MESNLNGMKEIKICIIGMYALKLFDPTCKVPHGGAEVDLFILANWLIKKNYYKIFFLVGDHGQKETLDCNGIKVIKGYFFNKKKFGYCSSIVQLGKFFYRLWKINADVYIQEAAGLETGLVALFCKLFKKKFIYRTAHDIDCNNEYVRNAGVSGKLFDFALRHADQIICQNQRQYDMLIQLSINPVIVGNAHNITQPFLGKKDVILWVARCESWKRPEIFLNIVNRFPRERFVMIAPKLDWQLELFDIISRKAAKIENIEFIEEVSFFKIQDYYNKAKLFVCTSDYEGFPNSYLQACLGGTPIMTLKVNPDNFIMSNNLGYCARGNLESLIKEIEVMLKNHNEWLIRSRNALQYVKKNHDINEVAGKWEDIINRVVKN